MPKPEQKVIIYRVGLREGDHAKSMRVNKVNAKYYNRTDECPRCGRLFKDASIKHYDDVKNRIPCLPPEKKPAV